MSEFLSAEAILDADDLGTEVVDVPAWGGKVLVRGMSGTERDRFEAGLMDKNMKQLPKDKMLENYRARLAASCMVNEDGSRMFRSEAEVRRLGTKRAEALQRVCDVAMRLSGMTEADQEELTGN